MKQIFLSILAALGLFIALLYFQEKTTWSYVLNLIVSILAVYAFTKVKSNVLIKKTKYGYWIISAIIVLICISVEWALETFPLGEPEQVVLTLGAPLTGFTSFFVKRYALEAFVPFLLIIVAITPWLFSIEGTRRKHFVVFATLGLIGIATVRVTLEIPFQEYKRVLSSWNKEENLVHSSFFTENYTAVDSLAITPNGNERNLILIIMESMENWDDSLIHEIVKMGRENTHFTSFEGFFSGGCEMAGSNSTITATVSKTTGVPYLAAQYDGDTILPNVQSIYDILRRQGYRNVFIQGTDAKFAHTDFFLSAHGIDKLYDLNSLSSFIDMNQDYLGKHKWRPGITDRSLYELAKTILDTLSNKNRFSLSIATIETHFPKGFYDEKCLEKPASSSDEDQFKATLKCASRQVFEFVEWIQSKDFGKNTEVVIVGDHLFKGKILTNHPNRRWIDIFINPAIQPATLKRDFSSIDIAPSIIESMGFDLPGHRMGFGTSLFSDASTLIEKYNDVKTVNKNFGKMIYSPEYYYLAKGIKWLEK